MSSRGLSTAPNLFDFFHEQVDTAVQAAGSPVSEDGVYYLTNLLVERGVQRSERDQPDTLAELHIQAAQGGRSEAIRSYRELGDQALYRAGFFRGSLKRCSVGVDYYVNMGSTAYDRLSSLLAAPRGAVVGEGGGRGLDEVYGELARRFAACTEVLREVREALRAGGSAERDVDVLRLYEEWLSTGSPRAAARLRELGVVPMRPGSGDSPC